VIFVQLTGQAIHTLAALRAYPGAQTAHVETEETSHVTSQGSQIQQFAAVQLTQVVVVA